MPDFFAIIKVLLVVFAIGIVLLVGAVTAVLFMRVRFVIHAQQDAYAVKVGFGPVLIEWTRFLNTLKNVRQTLREKKASAPKEEKKSEQPPKPKKKDEAIMPDEAMRLLLSILDDMSGLITVPTLRLDAVLWTKQPDVTGRALGYTSALVANLYPFLVSRFDIRQPHIWIDGNFEKEGKCTWTLDAEILTRPLRLLRFLKTNRPRISRLIRGVRALIRSVV